MSLNRSQLAWLSKLAKTGRAYAGFALPSSEIPEWAKLEFRLQRELIKMARRCERYEAARAAKRQAKRASRETLSSISAVLAERAAKPVVKKDFRAAAIKAAATRRRQAAARAQIDLEDAIAEAKRDAA